MWKLCFLAYVLAHSLRAHTNTHTHSHADTRMHAETYAHRHTHTSTHKHAHTLNERSKSLQTCPLRGQWHKHAHNCNTSPGIRVKFTLPFSRSTTLRLSMSASSSEGRNKEEEVMLAGRLHGQQKHCDHFRAARPRTWPQLSDCIWQKLSEMP